MEASNDFSTEPDLEALRVAYDFLQKKDYSTAEKHLLFLEAKGSRMAAVYLGWMFEEGLGVIQNFSSAHEWYKRSALQGSSVAQFKLARLAHTQGRNDEALKWFNAAASEGYLPALYWLGTIYERGEGCAIDDDKAEEYLRKAYERGHVFAKRDLARRSITRRGGNFGMWRGLVMYVEAVIEGARLARNDPNNERIH